MLFTVSDSERNRAKNPHELFILNLIAFHLLLTPLILAFGLGFYGLALIPAVSGLVIAFIAWRAYRAAPEPWFVRAHWILAFQRCKLLLLAYVVSLSLIGAAALFSVGADERMREIMLTVFTRVGVMPVVIMVFVTFALESSALYQAARGEVPDRLVARRPPPDDLASGGEDDGA